MSAHSRTPSMPDDLFRILEFARGHSRYCFHVVDLPYRLCSPAAQETQNVRLWENGSGEVVGFSVIQVPFSAIDWAIQPQYEPLAEVIVRWAAQRLTALARQRKGGLEFLFDSFIENDTIALEHGFKLTDWYMRRMSLALSHALDFPALPPGFTLRPLKGASEVNDYVGLHRAAFGTQNMTEDWRARTLAHPHYQPELDLVVEDDKGRLAAFCIGWMCEVNGEQIGQIDPLGVLPEFQRKGLGRAILLENLRRMRERGAIHILIDAESHNPTSQHLYESVGFHEISRTMKYFRKF